MKEASGLSTIVRSCMEYISTRIFDKISLESIADDLGYSRAYISRRLKEETLTNFMEVCKLFGTSRETVIRNLSALNLSDISHEDIAYIDAHYDSITVD